MIASVSDVNQRSVSNNFLSNVLRFFSLTITANNIGNPIGAKIILPVINAAINTIQFINYITLELYINLSSILKSDDVSTHFHSWR